MSDHVRVLFLVRSNGQSMAEYILPAAILGILVISTITTLNLTGVMGNNVQSSNGGELNSRVVKMKGMAAVSPSQLPQSGYFATYSLGFTVTDLNGKPVAVTLDGYPQHLSDAIEAAGADGSSHHLAELIRQLALSLKEKDAITEPQLNSLLTLADKGFVIADQETLIAEAFKNIDFSEFEEYDPNESEAHNYNLAVKRISKFSKIDVQDKDGNPTNLQKLIQTVGFFGPAPWDIPTQIKPGQLPGGAGKDIKAFLTAYEAADKSGALKNPAVSQIISTMVSQISYMGDQLESKHSQHEAVITAKVTQQDSGTICQTGGGTTAPHAKNKAPGGSIICQ